jgi:hypothetical protein
MGRVVGAKELEQIHRRGQGLILNPFYGVLHRADCDWVGRMSVGQPKEYFDSLAEARQELERRGGPEGDTWRRCPVCMPTLSVGSSRTQRESRPSADAHNERSGDEHYLVQGPANEDRAVEAWADAYVPYEPSTEWQQALRRELRERLRRLKARPDQVLHAILSGAKPLNADVENALTYNIDDTGRSFQGAAFRGIAFEHSPEPPPPAPDGRSYACRLHYAVEPRDAGFAAWRLGDELVSWPPVDVPGLAGEKKLEAVWLALHRAAITIAGVQRAASDPFAVELQVVPPQRTRPTTAALVKGVFDGVVCAFQCHQDAGTGPELAERLSRSLGSPTTELHSFLTRGDRAALGPTAKLLHFRGAGVQWAPADHLLVAGRLAVLPPSGEGWGLAGRLSAVSPRR